MKPFLRNPAFVLLVLTFAFLGVLIATGARLPIGQDEAIRREVRRHVASEDIDRRIETILKSGSVERARSYADLQTYMGWSTNPALRNKIDRVRSSSSEQVRIDGVDVAMAKKLGDKTGAVVELTDKHSLDEFSTSLSAIEFLLEHMVGFGAWLIALFGLALGRRIVPALHS
ncbi:MAG: hypothetical protein HY243_17345 [Proteobacteria bacterium]|nr:hypothetical protein [Pseudomonadota bacterium]